MNPKYFGDSYDIVKRFFCFELATLGYAITVKPMLTGDWAGNEGAFYRLIGAGPMPAPGPRTAVFFDPDTGVHERASIRHLSLLGLSTAARENDLAFSFDQSFSRQHVASEAMQHKLSLLMGMGSLGMYYDSHARFLFASSQASTINELRQHLLMLGLPASRLLTSNA